MVVAFRISFWSPVFSPALDVALAFRPASAFTSAFAGAFAVTVGVRAAGASVITVTIGIVGTLLSLLLSFYIGWQVWREDKKFELVQRIEMVLAVFGGTAFCGADLTGATFFEARLKSANIKSG